MRCPILVSVFAGALFLAQAVQSQPVYLLEFPYDVTAVFEEGANEEDYRLALRLLGEALQEEGGYESPKEGWYFVIGLSEEDHYGQVALSVATLYKLPESIVELGKKEEAFYMRIPSDKRTELDPAGKSIREYVSEEFMRQFADIQGHYVEIVQKSDLKKGIEDIVGQFAAKHLRK